jgi:hypothetical protein
MSSEYNWIITDDYIDNGIEVGVTGPRNKSRNTENEGEFRMLDDDGELYYRGKIWGDYDGFEPLDDFGMPNAGCTTIEYKSRPSATGGRPIWEVL